uniref:Uncharacterized protein n=1 Tax=mine drainage metagenome TaxID=410659 RepID=E6PZA5_9ZZZZ
MPAFPRPSTEAPGDVVLSTLVAWISKDFVRGIELDHATVEEEPSLLCDTCGLLHVVGDNDDGVLGFELKDEVFDLGGRNRIERGGWLVHKQHLGIDGKCAGDAHALLLTAGKAGTGFLLEFVFDFIPESGVAQRALYDFVEFAAVAIAIQLESAAHVVIDRHGGKGIGSLEDHANAAANLDRRSVGVDVQIADLDRAGDTCDGIGLVHAIDAAHESAFATARGADQRGGVIGGNVELDVLEGMCSSIPGVQTPDFNTDTH